MGASGKVVIGNNGFLGMNTIVCRNVTIGDNVIIGAGSIVTKNCEPNCVYAGSPTRKFVTLDDFYRKREMNQLDEAKTLAVAYHERFRNKPNPEVLHVVYRWEG